MTDKGFDLGADIAETHCYIQWKGTDVCMDFRCDCGDGGHFDGYFAYAVKCPGCGAVWEMPSHLFPRKVNDWKPGGPIVVEIEPDDDAIN